jgi:ATP-dependent RNA helicase DHX37/DHR1
VGGIQAFQIGWISKASASQRAGRAGRTGPGHCYRLFSSALYEHHFRQFADPEIVRAPIEGVVLQMKTMHIDAVINFPFPSPPDRTALRKAEAALIHLGALSPPPTGSIVVDARITELGRAMSLFPLAPRFARMLVGGRQHGCLPYVVAIVSALSVGDPFIREEALFADDEGHEDEEGPSDEVSLISGEVARAKEVRRLRRRAFFQSQHVRVPFNTTP